MEDAENDEVIENYLGFEIGSELSADDSDNSVSSLRWFQDSQSKVGLDRNSMWKVLQKIILTHNIIFDNCVYGILWIPRSTRENGQKANLKWIMVR